eukprot:scaffold183_cov249-Pinguiococcus_pyrenoidosus.AAC.13
MRHRKYTHTLLPCQGVDQAHSLGRGDWLDAARCVWRYPDAVEERSSRAASTCVEDNLSHVAFSGTHW